MVKLRVVCRISSGDAFLKKISADADVIVIKDKSMYNKVLISQNCLYLEYILCH